MGIRTPNTQRKTEENFTGSSRLWSAQLHTRDSRFSVVEITHWLSSFKKQKAEHKEPAQSPIRRDREALRWKIHIVETLYNAPCSEELTWTVRWHVYRRAGGIYVVLNIFSVHLICIYSTKASLLTCNVTYVNIITADQSDKLPCMLPVKHQAVDKPHG